MTEQRKAHEAYAKAADEYGVPEFAVRDVCGPIGKESGISFNERLQLLRAKMDAAGFIPVRAPDRDDTLCEPRELRSCVICESFLENDDEGEPVTHSEGELDDGVVCRNCIEPKVRM